MLKTLSFLLLSLFFFVGHAQTQNWHPAMDGIEPVQKGLFGYAYTIKFRNDLMGRDWIYGGYYDEDSLRRCVAYREGGRWKPLPFSGYYGNIAYDIEMYGDTLYIGGEFGDIVLDKDSSTLPNTGLLKWYNDSLWTSSTSSNPGPIYSPDDMTTKGDTLLIWGGSYYDPPNSVIYHQFMTADGGATWQYPYSIVHPTSNFADFAAPPHHLEILRNGDILTINNDSPRGNPFSGLARWDGQQWHAYGNGLFGSTSRVLDFEFYKGDLYMGGSFNRYDFPNDPANFVGHWDGSQWQELANGTQGTVKDLFVHDSTLYCYANSQQFGDTTIPFLAGWDGKQWCGTPTNFTIVPESFGFVKDTLYATFYLPGMAGNDSISYMNYFDGDYLHGPNAVCSTPGLGEEEVQVQQDQLKIFPNPTAGKLTISLPKEEKIHLLKVYDVNGRCVLQKFMQGPSSVELDVSGLAKGLYVLEINGTYRQKLVRE